MQALWDRHPELPYRAAAPWPYVDYHGQRDWSGSVCLVQSWLESSVGYHWRDWTWSMWTFDQSDLCCVSFRLERSATLFLLKFSS